MKTTTLPLRHSMNRAPLPLALLLIPLALGCFTLLQQAQATCQQGCLTNQNTVLGDDALINNTTGDGNTAVGFIALSSNTTGRQNVAIGYNALSSNVSGIVNVAIGPNALSSNTTGDDNTAIGNIALLENTTGSENTAIGSNALVSNRSTGNTAIGHAALDFNTTGGFNTAVGASALASNTIGRQNVAIGSPGVLSGNTTGDFNIAAGSLALVASTTGNGNIAIGRNALSSNTTGSFNIALGVEAGGNLTAGGNNIDIGNQGVAGEANTIRIGTSEKHTNTFIAGISGATVPTGVAVIVDANGHLGTTTSSAHFKEAIKPMDKASEAILALQPVTFRYKHDLDPKGIPQFGLVAEEVEKVNPDLVARDEQGKPYTVRYEAVNAMLLNEFLKEHKKVEEQQATIAQLKSTVAQQQKRLEAKMAAQEAQIGFLTAAFEKVSAQLELSKAAPQTVVKNR
jgi:Chaperone of endosialidase